MRHDAHILLDVGCQLLLSLVLVMPFSWMHFGRVGPGLVQLSDFLCPNLGFACIQMYLDVYLVRICKDLIRVVGQTRALSLPLSLPPSLHRYKSDPLV